MLSHNRLITERRSYHRMHVHPSTYLLPTNLDRVLNLGIVYKSVIATRRYLAYISVILLAVVLPNLTAGTRILV